MGLMAKLEWTLSHVNPAVRHRTDLASLIHVSVQWGLCSHDTVTLELLRSVKVCVCV